MSSSDYSDNSGNSDYSNYSDNNGNDSRSSDDSDNDNVPQTRKRGYYNRGIAHRYRSLSPVKRQRNNVGRAVTKSNRIANKISNLRKSLMRLLHGRRPPTILSLLESGARDWNDSESDEDDTEGEAELRRELSRLDATDLELFRPALLRNGTYRSLIMSCHDSRRLTLPELRSHTRTIAELLQFVQPPTMGEILELDTIHADKIEMIALHSGLESLDPLSTKYLRVVRQLQSRMDFSRSGENGAVIDAAANAMMAVHQERPYLMRILGSGFSSEIKQVLCDKYLRFSGDAFAGKYRSWFDTVLALPGAMVGQNAAAIPLRDRIIRLSNALNRRVFGMERVKEEILAQLSGNKFKMMALVGPPGVGKTMIARAIGDALSMPMQQLSLGGAHDAVFLEGHSFTYEGAEPGMIAKSLIKMKGNGIIYFDEVEKTAASRHSKDIEHALLHITDFTQNHDFRDHYMPEVPIDLSQCIFIFSMNSVENLDSALLSRMPIINISGYNDREKDVILERFILPEILQNYGLSNNEIIINKETRAALIMAANKIRAATNQFDRHFANGKTGVRELKNLCDRVIKRIHLRRIADGGIVFNDDNNDNISLIKYPFVVTPEVALRLADGDNSTNHCNLSYFS